MSIKKPMLIQSLITQSGGVLRGIAVTGGLTISYEDRIPLDALDASVELNIDGVSSSASIKLASGTNVDGRAYVEMFTVQGSAGVFRTRSPQIGYGGQNTTVQLEHAINEMGDFIIPDKIESAKEITLKDAMKKIFSYYSKKSNMWQLGTVDDPVNPDTDDTGIKCVLAVEYDNCLDAIQSVMEQYPYMMLEFNFSKTPWRLNVRNKPTIPEAQGRLSRNVKSATVVRDDSEMYNRVYAQKKDGKYGKKDAPSYWKNKYGLVETVISAENETDAIWSKTVASYLKSHKKPKYSITIDGIELSNITGEKLDKLTLGKMMTLAMPVYNTTISENITSVSFPSVYKQPNSCSITLNTDPDRVIKYIKKAQKTAKKAARSAGAVASSAFVDAKVDNNTLILTKGDGTQITFSKAVTLEGTWSSGKYSVKAFQTNNKIKKQVAITSTTLNGVRLQTDKNPTRSGTYDLYLPLNVTYATGNQYASYSDTGFNTAITVSAKPVYDKGWLDAYNKAIVPLTESVKNNYITIKTPAKTTGKQKAYIYSMNNASGLNDYVDLRIKPDGEENAITVARYKHNKYTSGWSAAYGKVKFPTSMETGHNYTTLKVPSSGVGDDVSYLLSVNKTSGMNDYVDISLKPDGGSSSVVIRYEHGKYTGGWGAAYGEVDIPTTTKTNSNSITVKTPASTVGNKNTRSYYMASTSGDDNSVDLFTTGDITVARFSHYKYNAGHDGVVSGDIDLNGSSSSTSSSKPSTALNRTDPTKITGYKWLKKANGTWKNLGSFSILTNATHIVNLYYLSNGVYTKCTKNKLYYYTE